MSFIIGMKWVAAVSVLAAVVMIAGASWTFHTAMMNIQVALHQLPYEYTSEMENENYYKWNEILEDIIHIWNANEPVLLSCSAIVIVVGVIQLIICILVLFSGSKIIRKRTRSWLTIHFILFVVLTVCLFSAVLAIAMHSGKDMRSWNSVVNELDARLKTMRSQEDFTELITCLKEGSTLFYAVVGQDIGVVIILFISAVFLMRSKEYDYECQP